jgi:hypothetical protein
MGEEACSDAYWLPCSCCISPYNDCPLSVQPCFDYENGLAP